MLDRREFLAGLTGLPLLTAVPALAVGEAPKLLTSVAKAAEPLYPKVVGVRVVFHLLDEHPSAKFSTNHYGDRFEPLYEKGTKIGSIVDFLVEQMQRFRDKRRREQLDLNPMYRYMNLRYKMPDRPRMHLRVAGMTHDRLRDWLEFNCAEFINAQLAGSMPQMVGVTGLSNTPSTYDWVWHETDGHGRPLLAKGRWGGMPSQRVPLV